jgi:hypothetical protein
VQDPDWVPHRSIRKVGCSEGEQHQPRCEVPGAGRKPSRVSSFSGSCCCFGHTYFYIFNTSYILSTNFDSVSQSQVVYTVLVFSNDNSEEASQVNLEKGLFRCQVLVHNHTRSIIQRHLSTNPDLWKTALCHVAVDLNPSDARYVSICLPLTPFMK